MLVVPAFAFVGWRGWLERLPTHPVGLRMLKWLPQGPASANTTLLGWFALPYLFVLLAVPLFARFVAPISPPVRLSPKGSEIEMTVDLDRTSWVELTPSSDPRGPQVGRIPAEQFKGRIFGSFRYFFPKQASVLDSISRPGIVLACPGSAAVEFLVIDSRHLNDKVGEISILGHTIPADVSNSPSFVEDSTVLP
jgi:hypothetical protein